MDDTLEKAQELIRPAADPGRIRALDRQPLLRAPGQLDIPFDGTTRTKCQWPAWGLESKKGDMCGLDSPAVRVAPYCNYHYRIAYSPKAK